VEVKNKKKPSRNEQRFLIAVKSPSLLRTKKIRFYAALVTTIATRQSLGQWYN
jgi:hypothetical protein